MKHNQRIYSLKRLIKWPLDWSFIKEGRDSGFPWCDIVWYKIRLLALYSYEIIFGNCNPFMGKIRTFYDNASYEAYKNSDEYKREPQHVLCPYHQLKMIIFKPIMPYYKCTKCNWQQFNNKICKRC